MCIGYAREIRAWLCDDMQNQRDEMMHAWSTAFEQSSDAPDASFKLSSFKLQPNADVFGAVDEYAKEHVASLRAVRVT